MSHIYIENLLQPEKTINDFYNSLLKKYENDIINMPNNDFLQKYRNSFYYKQLFDMEDFIYGCDKLCFVIFKSDNASLDDINNLVYVINFMLYKIEKSILDLNCYYWFLECFYFRFYRLLEEINYEDSYIIHYLELCIHSVRAIYKLANKYIDKGDIDNAKKILAKIPHVNDVYRQIDNDCYYKKIEILKVDILINYEKNINEGIKFLEEIYDDNEEAEEWLAYIVENHFI